jgi:hypothetical protein
MEGFKDKATGAFALKSDGEGGGHSATKGSVKRLYELGKAVVFLEFWK